MQSDQVMSPKNLDLNVKVSIGPMQDLWMGMGILLGET